MDHHDLEQVYSAKTDDELLALAAERRTLEPEAQSVLWTELRRRKLTDSHHLHPRAADDTPRPNLAFNLPAKAGGMLMLLALGAFGLAISVVALREHQFFKLVLIFVLFWGPIFAAIAWATHRTLRKGRHSSLKTRGTSTARPSNLTRCGDR